MTTEKKIGTCLGMPANGLELNAQSQDRKTKKMNTTKKNAIVHPIYTCHPFIHTMTVLREDVDVMTKQVSALLWYRTMRSSLRHINIYQSINQTANKVTLLRGYVSFFFIIYHQTPFFTSLKKKTHVWVGWGHRQQSGKTPNRTKDTTRNVWYFEAFRGALQAGCRCAAPDAHWTTEATRNACAHKQFLPQRVVFNFGKWSRDQAWADITCVRAGTC